jgi:hypothetical protein
MPPASIPAPPVAAPPSVASRIAPEGSGGAAASRPARPGSAQGAQAPALAGTILAGATLAGGLIGLALESLVRHPGAGVAGPLALSAGALGAAFAAAWLAGCRSAHRPAGARAGPEPPRGTVALPTVESLRPLFSEITDTLERLARELEAHPSSEPPGLWKRARVQAFQLATLSVLTGHRPLPPGVAPTVVSVWRTVDPEMMGGAPMRVRVVRELSRGEVMAGLPGHYLELLLWSVATGLASGADGGALLTVTVRHARDRVHVVFDRGGPARMTSRSAARFDPPGLVATKARGRRDGGPAPSAPARALAMAAARAIVEAYAGKLALEDGANADEQRVILELPVAAGQSPPVG